MDSYQAGATLNCYLQNTRLIHLPILLNNSPPQAELQSQCGPACPIWPDQADANSQSEASKSPVEHFMIAPAWLVGMFMGRGVHGLWGQHKGVRPQQVSIGADTEGWCRTC